MITLSQITSDIRNIAASGELAYAFRVEDELIHFWIHEVRAMMISQSIAKRQNITDTWVQEISCVPLVQVDESECCLVDTGCLVLRSETQLPHTIETVADNSIIRVVTSAGQIISKSNAFEVKYNKYNRYTAKKTQWFLKNGYLYILNDQFMEYINVYGLFEDPSELSNYTSCTGITCFSADDAYPVSNKMSNEITNYIIKTKVVPFLKFPQDNSNDGAKNESQLPGNPA